MTPYMRRVTLVLAVAMLAACGADRSTTSRKYAVLSDGRSDGFAGFYFLPPVAPMPATQLPNDPGHSPVVEITAIDVGGPVLARFEGDAVKYSEDHYMAEWSTKRFIPTIGTTYRIRVLLDGRELGYADAQVARDGRELRLLGSDEIFGLTGQRTVPIKFRIHGVVDDEDACLGVTCDPPAQCELSVACAPASGACVANQAPDGAACEDGDPCTVEDGCTGGACTPGVPRVCPDLGECNVGRCDPAAGCVTDPKVDGTNCTQTSGQWAGFPGVCALDATTGVSGCADITPTKPSY